MVVRCISVSIYFLWTGTLCGDNFQI